MRRCSDYLGYLLQLNSIVKVIQGNPKVGSLETWQNKLFFIFEKLKKTSRLSMHFVSWFAGSQG